MTQARFDTGERPALVLTGTGARPRSVDLVGSRARTSARLTGRGTTWRAVVPLTAARWGGPDLPLPSGEYRLTIAPAEPESSQERTPLEELPVTQLGGLRAQLVQDIVTVGPPIDPAYDSGEGQDALERRYATRPGGLENAVFFESFYGRNAGCNPLAIDRELARRAPGVTRYWSVVDLSVRVPDGAIPVVEGSPEWWRARGHSRLLVINDWLRRRFVRERGQVVLQTWHGTPLKRLALHRPGFDPRRMAAVFKESRRWNVLLAQNPYAAKARPTPSSPVRSGWRGIRATTSSCTETTGARAPLSGSVPRSECSSTRPPGATTAARSSTSSIPSRSPPTPTRSCSCAATPARFSRDVMRRVRA